MKRDKQQGGFYWLDPPKGLLYVKNPKAASSTTAGVVHRISRNHGGCAFKAEHTTSPGYLYGNRNKSASFLLGSIRDPASRAISRIFFHHVSRGRKSPTDENVIRWLNSTHSQFGVVSEGQGGFQLRYLALNHIKPGSAWSSEAPLEVKNREEVHANVEKLLQDYDFLIVVERIDESLVVLQMLLAIDIGDVLTLDSKVQGMYTFGRGRCFKNVKATVSPVVKNQLTSDVWYAQNYGDYVLHAAANASLDSTIDALGRERVEKAVTEYRRLKALASNLCSSTAYFPCSKDGEKQLKQARESCYKKDFGCGYKCIDEFLKLQTN